LNSSLDVFHPFKLVNETVDIDNESLKQQGVVVKEQLPKTLMGHILLIANNDAGISPNEITVLPRLGWNSKRFENCTDR